MTDPTLLAAQQRRKDEILNDLIEERLTVLLSAKDVGPEARKELRGLLAHYAKQPHPFRACVRDNMKRFGPGRTERVCATLKDIIRGTTKWRNGNAVAASDIPQIGKQAEKVLLSISDVELEQLVFEASDVA